MTRDCSAVSAKQQETLGEYVRVTAPVRTADVGGWTDTWFAGRGMVTNVAVGPGVGVEVRAVDGSPDEARIMIVDALALVHGEEPIPSSVAPLMYRFDGMVSLENPQASADPFVAMAVAVAGPKRRLEVTLRSSVPTACGLGTSAAISVAVIGAVWTIENRRFTMAELATAALAVETGLGLQSGIQDQLAAAFGGTHRFDVRYPTLGYAHRLTPDPVDLFADRLVTVYLGQPHSSSAIHEQVIAELEAGGHRRALDDLRVAAMNAAASLLRGDLRGFGRSMTEHNDATRRLHPTIVSTVADEIGAMAMDHGAVGWKANGAGGNGGTISLVASENCNERASLLERLRQHQVCEVLAVEPVANGFLVTSTA